MPIIIGLVLAFAAFYWWTMLRAKLFVQASTYLLQLDISGLSPEHANRLALSIDLYAAKALTQGALCHCQELFCGKQLALISEARLRGFRG